MLQHGFCTTKYRVEMCGPKDILEDVLLLSTIVPLFLNISPATVTLHP